MKNKSVFISYCHRDVTEEWIEKLVSALGQYGVNSIVDIYDLQLGQDLNYFMEQIERADKVLILSGKIYQEKANAREGGVGKETQIISSDVYNDVEQTKFIPIIIQKDKNGKPYLPHYLSSRYYTDFSDDNRMRNNFREVINLIKGLKRKKPKVEFDQNDLEEDSARIILKEILASWVNEDFSARKVEIKKIYQYFQEYYNKDNCSVEMIELGYLLTDIYERSEDFEKSLKIAKQVLQYYEHRKFGEDHLFDKNYIRKMIGCVYSIVIAKVDYLEKEKLLIEGEKMFPVVRDLCQEYCKSTYNSNKDKEFLLGLYYSDYGAFLLNKADYYKTKDKNYRYTDLYVEALRSHTKSLKHRMKMKQFTTELTNEEREEIQNMIGRSTSNIGTVLFRLCRYQKSIEKQEQALEIFEQLGDRDRINRTKVYIIGGYLKLWEGQVCTRTDYNKCKLYLDELMEFDSDNEKYSELKGQLNLFCFNYRK